jgi:hypothetical protein
LCFNHARPSPELAPYLYGYVQRIPGLEKVDRLFVFGCVAQNLLRLPKLIAQQQPATFREQCA